jgi:hypothetical protein
MPAGLSLAASLPVAHVMRFPIDTSRNEYVGDSKADNNHSNAETIIRSA